MNISRMTNRYSTMKPRAPLIWGILLSFSVALWGALPATAEFYTPAPSASPTVAVDNVLGRGCALSFVQGVLSICCEKTGQYNPKFSNCTRFAHNFHKLCAEYLGPENCFSVSIHCDKQNIHHRLNMIRLGDTYYLVEPQGKIYDQYPLPSPNIPDHVLDDLYPGGPCEQAVFSRVLPPNTESECVYNNANLVVGSPPTIDLRSLNKCYECCETEQLNPAVENPKPYCRSLCEMSFKPQDSEDPDAFFNSYCSNEYTGKACRLCCEYLQKGPACQSDCGEHVLGRDHDKAPAEDPDVCRTIEQLSTKAPRFWNCSSCCQQYIHKCLGENSIPCVMWRNKCTAECQKIPTPIAQATRTAVPRS